VRWLADECVAPQLVANLRALDHDVIFALEEYRSKPDTLLLGVAASERRLLLTEDNDFGELIFRKAGHFDVPGIVLLRLVSERSLEKWERLLDVITEHGERVAGHFVVIGETRVRFRALPPIG
jgi:predicted nuclease of predicted toxin-antitoxin system